jgi:hypothetical protein
MAASYPTTIKSFVTKADGEVFYASHITDLELEVVAIETALKTGPTELASASLSGATASEAVFTNSTKELVSNSITGSGNVVMSASPTLTGTIAAAAATFSVPLIVASGGTGLATLTDKNVLIGAGTGTVAGVAPGSSGNVLTSDGTDWASTAAGASGDVSKVSTPVNDQVGVWTGDGTIEGDSDLTFDGTKLTLGGGQLQFPATLNQSTDVNCLDDYEEGTWTPVFGGSGGTSGQTYSAGEQKGRYVKIGKFCHFSGKVHLTTKGTITTGLEIQGFPFTQAADPAGGTIFSQIGGWSTSVVWVAAYIAGSSTKSPLTAMTAAATAMVAPSTTFIANGVSLRFHGTYEVGNL